jgi:hypothetical protein
MSSLLERIDNLVRLDYTPEEARFLYIVATHSGYFTHSQFLRFSRIKPGKHSQKFLVKLLTRKHATFHAYQSGGRVYHVCSRTLFKAMERDDLRTRRRHQLDYIKTRLVVLDFVVGNQENDYLETEAEKAPFFESVMKVARNCLPSKVYGSKHSGNTTTRYFVDRFPLFVRDAGSAAPLVIFTYVDAGAATLKGFITHLEAYRALFAALPRHELVFIAPTERLFRAAAREFSRLVHDVANASSGDELLHYFHLRKRWEEGQRIVASEVVRLNVAKNQFGDKATSVLYQKWMDGSVTGHEVIASLSRGVPNGLGVFRAEKWGDALSVFERASQETREKRGEDSEESDSPSFSPEDFSQ